METAPLNAPSSAPIPAVVLILVAALALPLVAAPPAAAQPPVARATEVGPALAPAQELLDAQRPDAALDWLNRHLARSKKDAGALLLRSTAHFMLGDMEAGRKDLQRSLALEPTLRQGWLNSAALAVSEERYDDALAAFQRAEQLAPAAPENDLNVGTVLLLRGDLAPASERFSAYLAGAGDTADGYYLVASNYALAGYAALAVEHLRGAVERDERSRRRARADANFTALRDNPRFQRLMAHDGYEPPAGSHRAELAVPTAAYRGGQGPLLPAVLDALQLGGRTFDPNVEVTDAWALIWGEVRIKVSDVVGGNEGRVQLSAPATAFTPAEWHYLTEDLTRRIQRQAMARALGQGHGVATPDGQRP